LLIRPSRILSPPDLGDPDFPAKCVAWAGQIRFDMDETIALTKKTLAECRTLMAAVDRQLLKQK
jgi:hypothetical protein